MGTGAAMRAITMMRRGIRSLFRGALLLSLVLLLGVRDTIRTAMETGMGTRIRIGGKVGVGVGGGGDRGVLDNHEDAIVDPYTRPAGGLSPKNPTAPRRPAVQTRNAAPDYPPECVSSPLLDASSVTLSGSGHPSASRPRHDTRRTWPR